MLWRRGIVAGLIAAPLTAAAVALTARSHSRLRATESQVAITRMIAEMDVTPSGNADRDFVAMMVPHHEGAIEMARAELRRGHNEQLRRIAQEIIITQQQEIGALQRSLGNAPTQFARATAPAGVP